MAVQWADPPPIGGPQDPRSIYMERLRLVKEQPDRWASIRHGTPTAMQQAAQALRKRQYHVPPGLWEFTVRTYRRGVHGDQHTAQLFARFRGEPMDWQDRWKRSMAMRSRGSNVVFNDDGERVCPDCDTPLVMKNNRWPWRCDDCWAQVDPKWLRRRERLRAARGVSA